MKSVIVILGLIILFSALAVKAADLSIEFPCSQAGTLGACPDQSSSIPNYIIRFYRFGVGIAGVLAVGMITFGAVYRIINAGNASKQQEGTEMMTSAIWGVVLLLGSYLILRTINPRLVLLKLPELTLLDLPTGYEYQALPGATPPPEIPTSTETLGTAQAYCEKVAIDTPNYANCLAGWDKCKDGCVSLDIGIRRKPNQCRWFYEPSNCLVQTKTNTALLALRGVVSSIFWVSEAYPPAVKHDDGGHYNGCAVDIQIKPEPQNKDLLCAQVAQIMAAAVSAGFTATNEYKDCPGGKKFETTTGDNIHLHTLHCPQ